MSEPLSDSCDQVSGTQADDGLAARLRGFGPAGLLAILVILGGSLILPVLGAFLVLAWAKFSRTRWADIGFVGPRSWLIALAIGILFGVIFKLTMKILVMPLLGAPAINSAYHFLAGNRAALPAMILAIVIGAGFGEEVIYRGWMFERLGKLFGKSVCAKIATVLVTSVLFAAAHYSGQGLPGVEQAVITGSVFGTIFAVTGSIFLPMIAHGAFDLTAIAIIYWDIESSAAHLIFK
jgi:uncharacterized protein